MVSGREFWLSCFCWAEFKRNSRHAFAGNAWLHAEAPAVLRVSERHKAMKTNCRKKPLTFGEFIASIYDACGREKAKGIVRLAVKARLIEFRVQQRLMIF